MSNLIGKTIGQYRIVEHLGRGGMATVYKAFQSSMERYVAIKVLPEQLAQDPTFVERFRREAKAIAQLEHPHILPVFDYGEQSGITYMVMRCLESGTLTTRLKQHSIDVTEAVRFLIQVADALDYTHRRGIVHRDIKPSNILIDPHNQALLTDFGIAKAVEGVKGLTGGGIIGTPEYISPEQAQGQPIDGRSDIYALGVILYQVVVGRPPFEAETPAAVLMKHINDPLPIPRQVNPEVSEAMEQVILKALAKDPADRYQTAREMAEAMQAALPTIERQTMTQVSTAPSSTPSVPTTVQAESRQTGRRSMVAIIGVALVLICGIIAVGGGAFWWFSDRETVTVYPETTDEVVKPIAVTEEVIAEAAEDTPLPANTAAPTEPPAQATTPPKEEVAEIEPAEPILPNEPVKVKSGSSLEAAAELSMGLYNSTLIAEAEDWYKVEIPHANIMNLDFTPAENAENQHIKLFNPNHEEIWYANNVKALQTAAVTGIMNNTSGGTYYVQVTGGPGEYILALTLQSQNDAASGGDAGDEAGKALAVQMGESFSGQIGDFDEEDWYQFEIPDGHIFDLVFTPGDDVTGSHHLDLYNQDQGEIWQAYNINPPKTASLTRIMSDSSGGIYYLVISGSKGSYNFELVSQSQNDADLGSDAGSEGSTAIPIDLGEEDTSLSGQIGDFDKEDWYAVDVPNEHILNLAFTSAKENDKEQTVTIYNPGQQKVWEAWNIGPSMTAEMGIVMNNASGGAYYVVAGGGKGSYTIDLSTQSQNDADSGGDAADELVEALEIKTGQTFTGQIGHYDKEDWYQFTPKAGQVVSVTPGKDTEKAINIQLFNPEQKRIWNESSVKPTLTKSFELSEIVEGVYYVKIAAEDYGSYMLEIK